MSLNRGDRRHRTDRIVKRRLKACDKSDTYFHAKPGRLKKRPPVCWCQMCRLGRKPQKPKEDS